MKPPLVRTLSAVFSAILVVALTLTTTASAASTTKSLSTNFTLVNLGTSDASVVVDYVQPDGTPWTGSAFTSLTLTANGGQAIVRQYADTLTPGRGSVVISSSQPLGALVQMVNRVGVPTSGAYSGITTGSSDLFVPLVARQGSSATGIANTQLNIQNTGSADANVDVLFTKSGQSVVSFTKHIVGIKPNATYLYDIADEAGVSTNWFGSVEVVGLSNAKVAVVSNLYFGPDSLMSFNGFPVEKLDSNWFIPLLYSRLSNTLNTSLSIQNLDASQIDVGDLVLNCTKDLSYPGPGTLSIPNGMAIPIKGAFNYNTLIDSVNFPTNWQGSCKISTTSGKKFVALVMYRYTATADQAAYEAIPGSSTDKKVFVPLVAKRLSNGFATAVVIQNLTGTDATATLTYTPSSGGAPIVRTLVPIPANSSIVRNFRQGGTESPDIADGWQGSLMVDATQAVNAYIANTYITAPNGDQFMAYTGFTVP